MLGRSYLVDGVFICWWWKHVLAYSHCTNSLYMGVYVSFNLGSMKNLSTRVTKLHKTQHKVSGICRRLISCINIYGFGGNFVYHSSNMLFEFCVFKDKSQVLCIREQVSYHPTSKSLYGVWVGMKNSWHTYHEYVVKSNSGPTGEKCHTLRSKPCKCVEFDGTILLYLIWSLSLAFILRHG